MRHSNGKRSRGRSGRRTGGGGAQNANRAYDSNGPAGKLRGTAAQLVEKYTNLARDARVGRDRVLVENYLQHAEHYQRLINEIAAQQAQQQEQQQQQNEPAAQHSNGHDAKDQPAHEDQPKNVEAAQNGNGAGNGQSASVESASVDGMGDQPAIDVPQPEVPAEAAETAEKPAPRRRRRAKPAEEETGQAEEAAS